VQRPLKLVTLRHTLDEQINKNPPNGAKINKTAAKLGVNHAELFNPDSRVTIRGVMSCGFLHCGRKRDASLKFALALWGS